jgi:hypothetical protein
MLRKLGMVNAVGIGLALATAKSPALAFGPIARSVTAQRDLLDVSFWARPFPHGYTGWGPCIRYVPVETPWGVRWRRIRVCH